MSDIMVLSKLVEIEDYKFTIDKHLEYVGCELTFIIELIKQIKNNQNFMIIKNKFADRFKHSTENDKLMFLEFLIQRYIKQQTLYGQTSHNYNLFIKEININTKFSFGGLLIKSLPTFSVDNKEYALNNYFILIDNIFSGEECVAIEKILKDDMCWGNEFNIESWSTKGKNAFAVARQTDYIHINNDNNYLYYGFSSTPYTETRPPTPLNKVMLDFIINRIKLIKEYLLLDFPTDVNYAFFNRYDRKDNIAAHSDGEGAMKKNSPIISVSFGGTRKFTIQMGKHKHANYSFDIKQGTLLVMLRNSHYDSQKLFTHSVAPGTRNSTTRYNITLRNTECNLLNKFIYLNKYIGSLTKETLKYNTELKTVQEIKKRKVDDIRNK